MDTIYNPNSTGRENLKLWPNYLGLSTWYKGYFVAIGFFTNTPIIFFMNDGNYGTRPRHLLKSWKAALKIINTA